MSAPKRTTSMGGMLHVSTVGRKRKKKEFDFSKPPSEVERWRCVGAPTGALAMLRRLRLLTI